MSATNNAEILWAQRSNKFDADKASPSLPDDSFAASKLTQTARLLLGRSNQNII